MATGPARTIEIDISTPWPGPGRDPRRRGPALGAVVLVMAGVLVALTGPALLGAEVLRLAWRITATTDHFWVTENAVYTLDRAEARIRLTARDLRTGAPRWTLPLTGTLADVYARGESFLSSNFPPDATTGVRTNVLSRQGGLPRLAYPTAALPLVYLGSRVALLIDRDPAVPPDPDADGRTRAMGLDWTHVATTIDLDTGRPRWRMRLPAGVRWALPGVRTSGEGIVGLPPGQDWMVTSSTDGEVVVRDLDSAAVLSRRTFGALRQESYVAALADAVVVRLDDGDRASLDAYEPATLRPRWRFVPPVVDAEPVGCEPLLCLADTRSVWIVDPRDGRTIWRPTGPLLRPGPAGRVVVTGYGNQVVLFNTRRARTLGAEPGWRVVDYGAHTRSVVVVRVQTTGAGDLGLLDVGTGEARRLGRVNRWSPMAHCLHAGGRVACGDDALLRVWRIDA
jgi:hypothetical protein